MDYPKSATAYFVKKVMLVQTFGAFFIGGTRARRRADVIPVRRTDIGVPPPGRILLIFTSPGRDSTGDAIRHDRYGRHSHKESFSF